MKYLDLYILLIIYFFFDNWKLPPCSFKYNGEMKIKGKNCVLKCIYLKQRGEMY